MKNTTLKAFLIINSILLLGTFPSQAYSNTYELKHIFDEIYQLHTEKSAEETTYVLLPHLKPPSKLTPYSKLTPPAKNLVLSSAPLVLLGSASLLNPSWLGTLGRVPTFQKVLLSILGVGTVVGYLTDKISGDTPPSTLLSESFPTSSSPFTKEKGEFLGLENFHATPDPQNPLPLIITSPDSKEDLLKDLDQGQEQYPDAFSKDLPSRLHLKVSILGVATSLKALHKIAWHIKDHDLGSSHSELHRTYMEQVLAELIENPSLKAQDLITDPKTGKPHAGLGDLYGSPYLHVLLNTLGYLHNLKKIYNLSDQNIHELYVWWFSRFSSERTTILTRPSLSLSHYSPWMLSGSHRIIYYLQQWDQDWNSAHGYGDGLGSSPFTPITHEEYSTSPTILTDDASLINLAGKTKLYHKELIKNHGTQAAELDSLEAAYSHLYQDTFYDLYQIFLYARMVYSKLESIATTAKKFSLDNFAGETQTPVLGDHHSFKK